MSFSIRQLAEACGVTESAVRTNWMKHPEWPFGKAPFKESIVAQVLEWRDQTLTPNPAQSGGTLASADDVRVSQLQKRAKLKLTSEQAEMTAVKRKALAEQMHDVEACKAEQIERNNSLKQALLSYLPTECTRAEQERERLLGRPLSTLEKIDVIRGRVEEALRAISGDS